MDKLDLKIKELTDIIANRKQLYKRGIVVECHCDWKKDTCILGAKKQLRYLKHGSAQRDVNAYLTWASYPENVDAFMRKIGRAQSDAGPRQ